MNNVYLTGAIAGFIVGFLWMEHVTMLCIFGMKKESDFINAVRSSCYRVFVDKYKIKK